MTSKKKVYNVKDLKKVTEPMILRDSTYIVQVYKSGNSNVVTIPAHFPVKVGDEFFMSYDTDNTISLKKKKKKTSDITKEKDVKEFIGKYSTPMLKDMDIDELEEFLEGIYDE